MDTINQHIFRSLEKHADLCMQILKDRSWTYREVAAAVNGVVHELQERGVAPGDRVAIIAENSPWWLHAYLGILAAGAVAVPRGEDIPDAELFYILEHSGCRVVFSGSKRTTERLPARFTTIPIHDDGFPDPIEPEEYTLSTFAEAVQPDDLAVLLYTSGTTGQPKGVMLEHKNVAHQLRVAPPIVNMGPNDIWVSILPSWHTFELTVELCSFVSGGTTVYSSKRTLKEDLRKHRPHFFASVPRIWETIYAGARNAIRDKGLVARSLFGAAYWGTCQWKRGNPLGWPLHLLGEKVFYAKLRAATGGRLRYSVSGGGYLAPHIDRFFNYVGVPLLVGYGLTETAPVVALRDPVENVIGTIGRAVPETEIRIGDAGTILIRGPQVMRGYYKDEELTRTVVDHEGWFDSGDLATMDKKGDITFIGRKKETIVLSGGENIEPEPIENSLLQSALIDQVMLIGQDRKAIAALIVPAEGTSPTEDEIRKELRARTGPAAGFRSFESVNRFLILDEPFTPENGTLTQTLKMKRKMIVEKYKKQIEKLYA
jgi:long-chain acyl-CoA synthetase